MRINWKRFILIKITTIITIIFMIIMKVDNIVPTCFAKDAARAVFPELGAPSRSTLTYQR